jgi:signal peptidase I
MKRSAVLWLLGGISAAVAVVGCVVALRAFVLNPYRVPTGGMFPTVRSGAIIWGYKLAYRKPSDVRRGDVVVHRQGEVVYVKRVVGIPGDSIRTEGEKLYVNGELLPQRFVRAEGGLNVFSESLDKRAYEIAVQVAAPPKWEVRSVSVVVPKDSFFLLGDNRMNSMDSRYTGCCGWVDIVGRIML